MSTDQKLSHVLLDEGFHCALGDTEYAGGSDCGYIKRKEPNTWDTNNGTYVVYDEMGRPWVISGRNLKAGLLNQLCVDYRLGRGAFVPHSNDGGHFMLDTLPTL